MKFSKALKEQGFTLVELMVVVAIIGILSAVAIPNFKRYQAKTKTSEAKLQLSSVYSALTSLQSDYDAYATCLTDAGYSAAPSGNYYVIGFNANNTDANDIIVNNGGICTGGNFRFPADKSVAGVTAAVGWLGSINPSTHADYSLTVPSVTDEGDEFAVGASGAIDPANITAANADKWVINENKTLVNVNRGY